MAGPSVTLYGVHVRGAIGSLSFVALAACGGAEGPIPLKLVDAPPLPTMTPEAISASPLHFTERAWGPPEGAPSPAKICAVCAVDATSAIPRDEGPRIASILSPYLGALKECVARVGADRVNPRVHLTYTADGQPTNARVDVGGFENLECVKDARFPAVPASRGTTLHCEYTCSPPPRRNLTPVRSGKTPAPPPFLPRPMGPRF